MCKQEKSTFASRAAFVQESLQSVWPRGLLRVKRFVSPGRVKSMGEGGHLVQDASEGPYVGLVVVGLVVEKLGGHVVRRPDSRAGKVHRTLQHLANNKNVSVWSGD